MRRKLFMVMLFVAFLPNIVLAAIPLRNMNTEVQIDLMDLPDATRNAVISSIQSKKKELEKVAIKAKETISLETVTVENAEKWSGIANAMVSSIKSLCNGLNVEINTFAKTPVGLLTIGILLWKIVGVGSLIYVKNVFLWFIIVSIVGFSFRYFHMSKKIKTVKEDKETKSKETSYKYVKRHEWEEMKGKDEYNSLQVWSVVIHVALFVLTTVVFL